MIFLPRRASSRTPPLSPATRPKKRWNWQSWLAGARLPTSTFGLAFVLADDSGLEVDALNGAPGVHSARFAALDSAKTGNSSDADNNAKLLRLLKDVPVEKRTARFRCVLALAPVPGKSRELPRRFATRMNLKRQIFDGVCEGRIIFEPRGKNGFGYDPLFVPDGFEQTFAELGEETKNQSSHRSTALAKLKQWLDAFATGKCEL